MHQIILIPTPDGGYSAEVPTIPGCASYGETYEEALAKVEELIQLYIAKSKEETQEATNSERAASV